MVSPLSYSSNPADGGILYLDGLTAEKDQRILIISFNDLLIFPEDIDILEKRPSVSEEEIESINSKNLPEAEKQKLLDDLKKKTTEEKKAQKKEARKIAYEIAAQFNTRAAMNGRCKNKFMGVVLSFPESEREILEKDPQMMEDIVQDWLDGMGFEDAQHFAVYHYDSAQPHIHLYVNMVGPDLKVYDSFQTKYRSQQVNRDIEKKYGLKPGIGVDEKYKTDLDKTNPRNKARQEILNQVRHYLDGYICDLDSLKGCLNSKGVEIKISVHNNGQPGLVFSKDNQPFNGGDLGRMFTYKNLNDRLEENKRQLEIFKQLKDCMGGLGIVKYKRIPPKETRDESNKTKAQHRRKYETNGITAYVYTEKNERYAIFRLNEDFYISTTPVTKDIKPKEQLWMSVDGKVCSLYEILAAQSKPEKNNSEKQTVESPATGKKAAVATAVSGGGSSAPAPAFVPAGKTVRDNKSATNSGDGLDETEEYIDEDGNKRTRKKRKLKI